MKQCFDTLLPPLGDALHWLQRAVSSLLGPSPQITNPTKGLPLTVPRPWRADNIHCNTSKVHQCVPSATHAHAQCGHGILKELDHCQRTHPPEHVPCVPRAPPRSHQHTHTYGRGHPHRAPNGNEEEEEANGNGQSRGASLAKRTCQQRTQSKLTVVAEQQASHDRSVSRVKNRVPAA